MKKIVILLLAFILNSCNDGNFSVPVFNFTNTITSCGQYILYKTSTDKTEVLILTLTPTQIGNIIGDTSYPISSTVSITYRIFNTGIDGNYFCQTIPPATPTIKKELLAVSGNVNISTSEILKNGVVTGYSYSITMSKLLFDTNNERVYFDNFDFGIFTVNL